MKKISTFLCMIICFFAFITVIRAEETIPVIEEETKEPVVISLLKPSVTANTRTYNSLSLEIKHTDINATGYQIYMSTSKSGKYTKIATIKFTEEELNTVKTYVKTKLTFNKTYYYKVRSYNVTNGKTKYSSYSSIISKKVVLAKVNLKAESTTYLKNKLTWGKVTSASGYEVYKLINGKYTLLKTTTSLTYTNTLKNTLNQAQNVNVYKVRAYKKSGTKKIYGPYSSVITVTSNLNVPSLKYDSRGIKSFNITSSVVEGASGYEVYECILEECTLFVSENKINSNIDTVSMSEVHNYKIRAYRILNNEEKLYGEFSQVYNFNSTPESFKLKSGNISYGIVNKNNIYINLNSNYDNVSFLVYRSTSKTGTYSLNTDVLCDKIGDTQYTCNDITVKAGKTYYYKIITIVNEEGIDYQSTYSDIFSISIKPFKITSLDKSPYTYNSTIVVWEAETWYDGYEVYRSTSKTGKYTLLKTTTNDYTINTGLTLGKTYYYKVRAYIKDEKGKKIYGSFSKIISRKVVAVQSIDKYPVELIGYDSSSIIKSATFTKKSVIGSNVIYKFTMNFSKTWSTYKQKIYFTAYFYDCAGNYLTSQNIYVNVPKGTKRNYSTTVEIRIPKTAVYWFFE